MSPLASRRTLAAASSLVLAAIGLTGCISLPGGGGGSSSSDISKMKNIPEGIKQDLISQLNSASGSEKKEILEKATALNNVVGTQLIAVDPSIASGQKQLRPVRRPGLPVLLLVDHRHRRQRLKPRLRVDPQDRQPRSHRPTPRPPLQSRQVSNRRIAAHSHSASTH